MPGHRVSYGLTLPNRGVLFGVTTPAELVDLGEAAEQSGCFDSVWVGDSLLAKPRLDGTMLLAGVAARTRRVELGPACLASFPLRHPVHLAYEWASLDQIAGGRTIMVACMGGGSRQAGGDFLHEFRTMGVPPEERVGRMEEGIAILRRLWQEDRVTFQGRHYHLEEVTVEPKPARRPLPIWIANNPQTFGAGEATLSRAATRVARLADGWMTTLVSPDGFREGWARVQAALRAEGRDPERFPNCLYFNVHVGEDLPRAFAESKRFIDQYYMTDFPREIVDRWVAYGDVRRIAEHIERFVEAGVRLFTLRLTAWDQPGQLRRVIDELMPRLPR